MARNLKDNESYIIHYHSSGNTMPAATDLELGELAVIAGAEDPGVVLKDIDNNLHKLSAFPNSQYGGTDTVYNTRTAYLKSKNALLKAEKTFETNDFLMFDEATESPDGVAYSKWLVELKVMNITTSGSLDGVSAKLVAYADGDSGDIYNCYYFDGDWSKWESVGAGSIIPLAKDDYDALPEEDKKKENVAYFVQDDDDAVETLFTDKLAEAMSKALAKEFLDALYPIGSYSFGVKPAFGTWEEVVGDRALWIKNTADDGTTIEQALPNITGGPIGTQNTNEAGFAANRNRGALYSNGGSAYSVNANSTGATTGQLYFDASRSNGVYKNNANVQPNAYVIKVFKRIA